MGQVLGSISNIVPESAVESALLWVLVLAYLRWFRVTNPAARAVAFLLPLLIPVALTTTFHVVLPQRPTAVPYFKLLETHISKHVSELLSVWLLFLLAGMAGVAASLVLVWRQWQTWTQARSTWERQQQQDTPLQRRCNSVLNTLATRVGCPAPRLVFVDRGSPGCLALGGCGYIFVPRALAAQLDDEELEALLAHEMSHIVRKDDLLGCLAKVCRNLMLFNPLAYLALSKLEKEQEEATDELAIRMGCQRLALASCLLKAYRLGCRYAGLPLPALLNRQSTLERRVRRLIDGPEVRTPSRVAWLTLGLLAGVATAGFALVV